MSTTAVSSITTNQKNWMTIGALCGGILILGIWNPTRTFAERFGIFCLLILIFNIVKNGQLSTLLKGTT